MNELLGALGLLISITLGADPTPTQAARPKPLNPVIFAQSLDGTALGPELLDGVTAPKLKQDAVNPRRWLAVEVYLSPGPAGDVKPVPLALITRQGKRRTVQTLTVGKSGDDTDLAPFFVELSGCAPLELTAKLNNRQVSTRTLEIVCD